MRVPRSSGSGSGSGSRSSNSPKCKKNAKDLTSSTSIGKGALPEVLKDTLCYFGTCVPDLDIEEAARDQHICSAQTALEYYNKKNAKPKLTPTGDSSTKLFFAELLEAKPFHMVVTACCVLKGKTKGGCESCDLPHHPSRGFRRGLYRHLPRALRSSGADDDYGY